MVEWLLFRGVMGKNKILIVCGSTWKINRFGSQLGYVLQEMEMAAENTEDSLSSMAYSYGMHIRPGIPHGTHSSTMGPLDIYYTQS
jgi:hypothetical protein